MTAFVAPAKLPNGQELIDEGHAGARGSQRSWIYTMPRNHARHEALIQSEIEAILADAA